MGQISEIYIQVNQVQILERVGATPLQLVVRQIPTGSQTHSKQLIQQLTIQPVL